MDSSLRTATMHLESAYGILQKYAESSEHVAALLQEAGSRSTEASNGFRKSSEGTKDSSAPAILAELAVARVNAEELKACVIRLGRLASEQLVAVSEILMELRENETTLSWAHEAHTSLVGANHTAAEDIKKAAERL
jgi:hypothetical protein